MAGAVSEDFVAGRSSEGLSSGLTCQSGDALSEWRSSEQVENGTPSTSPPYWDTDDSDDDGGLKPSDLYGKNTWKIEKFSQINKRELRSNAFDVGGYKWYILIYPQGCDVCNHLSLFLCVANHDKLLPGWSHFAQFTIAVVNKDPKKSKYSDTLHRFWKKEHDWGWKKFMELSKVSDGFVEADTLIIKAQVQVIREKADRPFRCLDCQYRRELVRVYLTNVEQICRRFVEERRGKLGKLLEDKTRWSSFCAFWLGMDQNSKRCMSKEKKDTILKAVVKHFFIEKEVTSTLVMDSLYSGLKALEGQSKGKKEKDKLLEGEDTSAPIVKVEKDMFVLVDDILLLLERAAMEPLPPKDDKGPQNRTKDGSSGEDFTKDSIERDERRLTELGRRTVEIFVLAHIFSTKIEVAYQEAVALKRQEELIREEEAAWLAGNEQKAKRGVEKDKKSKKKQGKQKRNNRKGKDKAKDEKPFVTMQDKQLNENLVEGKDVLESQTIPEKDDRLEEVSDVSDSEFSVDMLQHDSEERDVSPVNWDTDTSEIHHPAEASGSEVSSTLVVQNGGADKRNSSVLDDSSSTCSTDSSPSVAMNGSFRSNSFASFKTQKSPTRGKVQRGKVVDEDYVGLNVAESHPREAADASFQNSASSRKATDSNDSEDAVTSLQDRTEWPDLNSSVKKQEDVVVLLQRKPNNKDNLNPGTSQEKLGRSSNFPKSPPRSTSAAAVDPVSAVNPKSDLKSIHHAEHVPASGKTLLNGQGDKATTLANPSQATTVLKPDSSKSSLSSTERISGQQTAGLSRPSSAPVIPGTVSVSPVVSMVQTTVPNTILLSRSVSATGCLGPDPLALGHAFVPQSYRNAIVGNSLNSSTVGFTQSPQQTSARVNAPTFSQPASVASAQMYHQASESMEPNNVTSGISFAATPREEVPSSQPWMENPMTDVTGSSMLDSSSSFRDVLNFVSYRPLNLGSHELFLTELSVGTSGRQVQGAVADEFPHLDIINDLLDDEQGLGRATQASTTFQACGGGFYSRQFTYPTDHMSLSCELGSLGNSCRFDRSRSYPDGGFHQAYTAGSHYEAVGELMPQGNSMPYVNSQMDSMVPNQWQVMGPDLSLLSMSSGMEDYPYSISDYTNMACGVNGYAMFRPSNGY